MWAVIQHITTGLTLVAFIGALALYAYRLNLKHRRELINTVPRQQRADVITKELNTFGIKATNLSREHQFNLAGRHIDLRARNSAIAGVIAVVAMCVFGGIAMFAITTSTTTNTPAQPKKTEAQRPFVGTLLPGNDPNPSGFACGFKPDAFGVYLGSVWAGKATRFPHTVIRVLDKNLLVLNRNEKKEISIDLFAYGEDGRPIATIVANRFELNEHNFLRMELTADTTNLIVYNLYNQQALNLKYLNETAVQITGLLSYRSHTVTITDKTITMGPRTLSGSGNCVEGAVLADICIECN